MTEIERKARVEFLRTEAEFTHEFHIAADQIEADGKRIEALEAENERLRDQLEYAVKELSSYRAKYMVGTSAPLGDSHD